MFGNDKTQVDRSVDLIHTRFTIIFGLKMTHSPGLVVVAAGVRAEA